MSRAEYSFASMPLDECAARFRDAPRFAAFCRECERWNACWACPPLTVNPDEYLRPFRRVTFVAARIFFDDGERRSARAPETVRATTRRVMAERKSRLFDALLSCEAAVPGSLQLASGGCHLCAVCARSLGAPCRHPARLRYSLDSFGFDLTEICRELLGIRLLWSDGSSLPEYYTLVHALLGPRDAAAEARRFLGA